MKATQAQIVGLLVRENGMHVSRLDMEKVDNINITDRCVHIFFKDGSRLFINPDPFDPLHFKAEGGTPS